MRLLYLKWGGCQGSSKDFCDDFLVIFVEGLGRFDPVHIVQTVTIGGGGTEPLAGSPFDLLGTVFDHITTDTVVQIPEEVVCRFVVADPEDQVPSGAIGVTVVGGVVVHACIVAEG